MHNNYSFEKIFHEHYSPLCNYAAKIVKEYDLAEEIVQDLFVHLLEKNSLEGVEHVDRFLLRSVKFKCIDFLRKQKKSNQVVFEHLLQTDVLENEISSEEEVEALFDYLVAKLPPKTKEVFLLVRQSGLSYKEAAAQLHISDKTVENQMSRALKKLRMLLKDAGYLSWIYLSIFLK
jgi:RNA polymerase sigma-70 factor (ECF subfamily)